MDAQTRRTIGKLCGLRDYLFCVGIHVSCNSRRCPRSAALLFAAMRFLVAGLVLFGWMIAARALPNSAPMDVYILLRS